ncbi:MULTISPECIES: type II toxin-antitoxin system HigA family antitoxin [unclassified Imperialibacter]|uniref:helix-turn-helix domain-containing protein n=1 Tax=unclassified Imperialibacter TaxID=2629706 RepID=UPI001257BD9A|nr:MULTISPECIES: helix-turn-helix domain-containing protein [unclassified Imperialibacter]CAD5251240.1 HTH-type transcriptional regulator / antitoxin HigA [Imperialibacter sp. 89]CAD5284272.1 HTH-type transcriptional regulator / antitoxin HigA [Imperialibacter sp. 75]VVT11045.1 HTH-type transcriptional regulator / antitoxin HigA [Imperialibacter sp. EC-SDR9]
MGLAYKQKFTVIRNDKRYKSYGNDLEEMTARYSKNTSDESFDLIDTVTLLIEIYDEEHASDRGADPIQLLKYLMKENNLRQTQVARMLGISEGHLSDILSYKKGLSKVIVSMPAERFKVRQDAFYRPVSRY